MSKADSNDMDKFENRLEPVRTISIGAIAMKVEPNGATGFVQRIRHLQGQLAVVGQISAPVQLMTLAIATTACQSNEY